MRTNRYPRNFSTWQTVAMTALAIIAVLALTWWLYIIKSGV